MRLRNTYTALVVRRAKELGISEDELLKLLAEGPKVSEAMRNMVSPGLPNKVQLEAFGIRVCHLVLMGKYYDAIDKEEKIIEYRDDTPYWRKRLFGCTHVILHRGYTRTSIMFRTQRIICNGTQIEIHLGERLSS